MADDDDQDLELEVDEDDELDDHFDLSGVAPASAFYEAPEGYRSGFASFVGRPNAGKSTLTNALVGQKVVITSDKPQTTRTVVRGIVHRPDAQLILVDTPGLHRPRTLLGERLNDLVHTTWAEVPDDLTGYLPDGVDVTWLEPPGPGESALASVVEGIDWPDGEGYFWMAGESAQMRAIRKHLMRDRRLPSTAYDVMGYWRAVAARQPRAVDPGPIWRAGQAAGKSDEEIWAQYDEARS